MGWRKPDSCVWIRAFIPDMNSRNVFGANAVALNDSTLVTRWVLQFSATMRNGNPKSFRMMPRGGQLMMRGNGFLFQKLQIVRGGNMRYKRTIITVSVLVLTGWALVQCNADAQRDFVVQQTQEKACADQNLTLFWDKMDGPICGFLIDSDGNRKDPG